MTDQSDTDTQDAGQQDTSQVVDTTQDDGAGAQEPDLKAEADKWKALARKHEAKAKENAAAARELEQVKDRDKSDADKLAEKAAEAERRATEAEGSLLRFQVAAAKSLPSELIPRLRGDSQEELEADADELLKLVAPPTKPVGGFDGGPRGGNERVSPKTPEEQHNELLSGLFGPRST